MIQREPHKVFADPKKGIAFHKVFGRDTGKMAFISFLNAILDLSGEQAITHFIKVPVLKIPRIPYLPQEFFLTSHLVVNATTYTGVTFTVDMRIKTPADHKAEEIYQHATAYLARIQKRPLHPKPHQIICIIMTDFLISETSDYRSIYTLVDHMLVDNSPLFENLLYTWIELPNFHKTAGDTRTIFEQWLYFFKHADMLQEIPQSFLNSYELVDAFERIRLQNWTEKDIDAYELFRDEEPHYTCK